MPDDKSLAGGAVATRRARTSDRNDEGGTALIEISLEGWKEIEDRGDQLKGLDESFHRYVNEMFASADLCVEGYQRFSKNHWYWRQTIIMGAGLVALLNLASAYKWNHEGSQLPISLAAAVAAVILSILTNLESSSKCLDQAQAYRESRELFLDAAREFHRMWEIYVLPLGDSPEACLNAVELYRRIVVKDRELRSKLKDLTKTDEKRKK
jgi:hypothetical protein